MPSRIDEAGHTKAFDYPVAEHWGGGPKCSAQQGLEPPTGWLTGGCYQLSHPGSPLVVKVVGCVGVLRPVSI